MSGADEHRAVSGADEHRAVSGADEHRAESGADEHRAETGADEHRAVTGGDEHRAVSGGDEVRTWLEHPLGRLDELLGRRVSLRALALLRVLVGPITLLHLRPYVEDAADGFVYRDAFHHDYVSWYPHLPRSLYIGLLVVGCLAAVAMTLGVLARVATITTFAVVGYNLFLSTTHFHNNAAYLVIVLGILAMAPCGQELSVDAWWRRRRRRPPLDPEGPAWTLWLLRVECAVVYGASGFSKLVDPDWFGGTVTWGRIVNVESQLRASILPDVAVDLLTQRSTHVVVAKVIVATELFIALGLWWRRSRLAAVWIAVAFHIAIEVSASVQVFSYLGIAVLVVWAEPATRDRLVLVGRGRRHAGITTTAIRRLDWLARFRILAVDGRGLQVVDRDRSVRSGVDAGAFVASRLPASAFFALPLAALGRHRRRAGPPPSAAAPVVGERAVAGHDER